MVSLCTILAAGMVVVLASTYAAYAAPGTPAVRFVADDVAPLLATTPTPNDRELRGASLVKLPPLDSRTSAALAQRVAERPSLTDAVKAGPKVLTLPSGAVPAGTRKAAARKSRVMRMEVTAYCPCKKCCGRRAKGLTASGKRVSYSGGKFVAADTDVLPFGTRIQIPGYHGGRAVEVVDRGSAIKGHRIDVFFKSHGTAEEWGRRWVAVTVLD
jgi:3D (Asp-Asp-Asp) domain-containing protein